MEITEAEVLDLLNKWRSEERNVTCGILTIIRDGKTLELGRVIGQIKTLSPGAVRVGSIYGPPGVQVFTYVEIPLTRVARYRYLEPKPLAESCLRVHLEGGSIVFSLSVLP
ncbi:MAG TPA: hypothetical protein VN948_15035 [Terriglobales bacterium]|nr:hypothetical protein [Terriglobales bacterium]